MPRAGIFGVGSCLPQKVVTNADLSRQVDTSDEWIRTRTGIAERRVSDEQTATSDLAIKAAQVALKNSGMQAKQLELILVATSSPDMLFPSTGCILQGALGAECPAFDLSAACSGFNFALANAAALIESKKYSTILVVGADTLTKYLDWQDRSTCVLFGDGAGAVILKAVEDGSGVISSYLLSEGSGGKYLIMPGGGSRDPSGKNPRFIKMDGKEVFKFAVRAFEETLLKAILSAGLSVKNIDLLIPHQANIRIIDHVIKKLGVDSAKVFVNLQKYGNTSAASIPIALDEAMQDGRIKKGQDGRIKKGDILALVGFGAGLTAGANIVKWSF